MKADSGITVRPASAADAAVMSLIHKRAWVKAYKRLIGQSYLDGLKDNRWVRLFEKNFSEGAMTAWMACTEGRPVACACVCASRYAGTEDALELQSIYCLPEYWGRGAGHALMQRVKDHARAEGCERKLTEGVRRERKSVETFSVESIGDIACA